MADQGAPLFTGVGVALVTLFRDDGSLDAAATAGHAARLAALGVRAIVDPGSTGEAAALDADERSELIRAVREELAGGTPVIAGTGAPSARQAVDLTRRAVEAGADGVLVLSPPGSRDLDAYYGQVRQAAGTTPLLAYHFPASSSPGIPHERLPDLPVDGCKDSSGDPSRLLLTLTSFDRPLYVGSDRHPRARGAARCRRGDPRPRQRRAGTLHRRVRRRLRCATGVVSSASHDAPRCRSRSHLGM